MTLYSHEAEPVEVLVAAFDDEAGAATALARLKTLHKEKKLTLKDAAIVSRDDKGKLYIKETADMPAGKGAVVGAVVGGVIGLLAGPLVVVGALGALIGGLAARVSDSGIANERLDAIGRALQAGNSVLVVTMEHAWVEQARKELQEAGADVISQQISADIVADLEAKHQEE